MSDPGTLEKVLTAATAAVTAIDSGKASLDDVLDRSALEYRRTLEHLLLNLFRFRKSVRKQWLVFCQRQPAPEIAALLDTALSQCRFQSAVAPQSVVNVAVSLAKRRRADKFVNAVMRKALGAGWTAPDQAADILPDDVLKWWQHHFLPAEIEKFAALFISEAPFTFRLCCDAAMPENCTLLPADGKFRFAAGNGREILASEAFRQGKYYVQDPAAAMAVSLAADKISAAGSVLDLCAAPGGKSLLMAELLAPAAQLTAADRSARRQQLTAENFRKFQVNGNIITATPEKICGQFEVVFADVPCSNTGVFRRRPDALWRFSESKLKDVMKLQRQILTAALPLVAPGGTLVCSTCSIDPVENDALVQIALARGFTLEKSRTLLPDTTCDGAFAAVLSR